MQSRKMPSGRAVVNFWKAELERLGKADQVELSACLSQKPLEGICFACGWIEELEKAHITARCEDGSDSVENIHLLCRRCHFTSERLSGGDYWNWFNSQNMWSALASKAIAVRPELIYALPLPEAQ